MSEISSNSLSADGSPKFLPSADGELLSVCVRRLPPPPPGGASRPPLCPSPLPTGGSPGMLSPFGLHGLAPSLAGGFPAMGGMGGMPGMGGGMTGGMGGGEN